MPLAPLSPSSNAGEYPVYPEGLIKSCTPSFSFQVNILFCATSVKIKLFEFSSHKGPSETINESAIISIFEDLSIIDIIESSIIVMSSFLISV